MIKGFMSPQIFLLLIRRSIQDFYEGGGGGGEDVCGCLMQTPPPPPPPPPNGAYAVMTLSSMLGQTSFLSFFLFFFAFLFPLSFSYLFLFFLSPFFLHAMLTKGIFSLCVCVCEGQNVCDSVCPLYKAD